MPKSCSALNAQLYLKMSFIIFLLYSPLTYEVSALLFKSTIFATSLLIAMGSTAVNANNTIHWQNIHFPPLTILKGPDKGKGQLDHFLPYLQKQLSQHQHLNVEMNWARTFKMIEKGEHYCSTMVFKTPEREAIAEFSVPVAIALPIRIIMSKEHIARLGNPASYSLTKLIKNENLQASLVNHRSYTPVIDNILKEYQGATNLHRRAIVSESLIQMLKFNRVDYMLEYPATVSYLTKNDSQFKQSFSSIAIEEIAPLAVTYIACPRNA